MTLTRLWELGFDLSCYHQDTNEFYPRCSQCEALCINGVPTHEHGCPNMKGECKGCGEIIEKHQKYCEDCQ